MSNLFTYTLRIADSSLILGQRMAQLCTKGPTLEEDIALSNISLDMFGQANGFYEYAAQLDGTKSADDLAFLRNEREFFNHQMVEIENGLVHFGLVYFYFQKMEQKKYFILLQKIAHCFPIQF